MKAPDYFVTELFLVVRALQAGKVNLVHLKHGLHDSLRFFAIFVAQHFAQSRGNDLPGQTKSVFQPAATTLLSAGRELGPQLVDFFLRLAGHEERYGFGEFELWTAVEGHEFLSLKLERCTHDLAGGARRSFWITTDPANLGIFENGGIEIHGLLGVIVEPQERGDFWHRWFVAFC